MVFFRFFFTIQKRVVCAFPIKLKRKYSKKRVPGAEIETVLPGGPGLMGTLTGIWGSPGSPCPEGALIGSRAGTDGTVIGFPIGGRGCGRCCGREGKPICWRLGFTRINVNFNRVHLCLPRLLPKFDNCRVLSDDEVMPWFAW